MRAFLLVFLAFVAIAADPIADPALTAQLLKVEARYNRIKTLEVPFRETYQAPGRTRVTESGTLILRKPGRMRWVYEQPAGKLFISDGKYAYLYVPTANRVERFSLKEAEDYRAPLAFLLGKLNFRRDFANIQQQPDSWILLVPKGDRLPYRSVRMRLSAEGQIERMQVVGTDQSNLEFEFGSEKINAPAADALFTFRAPPNVEMIDSARGQK